MSKNIITILVLLIPVSIWLNLYGYYKYGRQLIKNRNERKRREGEKRKE